MNRTARSLVFAAVLLLALAGVAYAAAGPDDPAVLADLARVRQATAKYHNVDVAIADGYLPTEICVAEPGLGGMGYHYVNPSLAMDPSIDLAAPELLLYARVGGQLKLVGVEYFRGVGAPGAPVPNPAPPAPELFGTTFDGPMLGHEPGMPPHYDLHVWLWQPNPAGMFSPFNPSVSCP